MDFKDKSAGVRNSGGWLDPLNVISDPARHPLRRYAPASAFGVLIAALLLAYGGGVSYPAAGALGVLVLAVLVAYYAAARAGQELRRAAVFVERNPHPVLRLASNGEILYANRAAAELARAIGAASAKALLPPDLPERLTPLRVGPERYAVWQYRREARALECEVHFLPDLRVFYAYITDVTDRRLNEERLVYQAYHHALTGLPNRQMFQELVEQTLGAPEHGEMQAAVLVIGVDRYKMLADTMGHAIGEQLSQAVAARLGAALEECRTYSRHATLYHFDSDVYAVFAPGLASGQAAAQIAEQLVHQAAPPLYVAGREFFLGVSVGIALFPGDGKDAAALVKNATSAMQRARSQGGRGFRLYKPEMNALATHWLALENYLRHAIERDELKLYYQPQLDIYTGRVVALEALLRWKHPQRGLLMPDAFIRLAEDSGMIHAIGEWVLRAACAQNRAWRERDLIHTAVAVNISARQFHRQNLPALIGKTLADTGLPGEALELEITESVAMEDAARTTDMLHELKHMGVALAIDDFGVGFSSLAYLRRFPIDRLKIDRSFVRHIATSDTDAAIVRVVVTLGHALGLRVGAEGVETREQLLRLRQYECDEAQGVLYSRPLPAAEVEAFLAAPRGVGRPAKA